MIDQDPNAASAADAAILAALLRLAVREHGSLTVQEELTSIPSRIESKPEFERPYNARIAEIKHLAGLE